MADTHRDRDVPELAGLTRALMEERAKQMTERGENRITAGAPEEQPLHEEQVGMFFVRKLPDDPDAIRISIGEPHVAGPGAYVVIRGRTSSAIELIERALAALRVSGIESSGD